MLSTAAAMLWARFGHGHDPQAANGSTWQLVVFTASATIDALPPGRWQNRHPALHLRLHWYLHFLQSTGVHRCQLAAKRRVWRGVAGTL